MMTFKSEMNDIEATIKAWDGEDLTSLLPALRSYEAMKQNPDFSPTYDGVDLALADAGSRADLPWPSPWDEEECPFAIAIDRKGQYLSKTVRWHEGRYTVVPDLNGEFSDCR
jgi:hypothetical protein